MKMINRFFLFASVIGTTFFSCTQSNKFVEKQLLDKADKLIVVIPEHSDSVRANIYLLNKSNSKWEIVDKPIKGVIGRNGIAIGIGLHSKQFFKKFSNMPVKKEGDGRSPAGIFSIGNIMGFADSLSFETSLKYQKILGSTHCVDDENSEYYNTIVDTNNLKTAFKEYYQSYENMSNINVQYNWMFVINHNTERLKGQGSCIFFHIWKDENIGTSGCTAVSEKDILKIIKFITKNTLVVQLPQNIYDKEHTSLRLPDL